MESFLTIMRMNFAPADGDDMAADSWRCSTVSAGYKDLSILSLACMMLCNIGQNTYLVDGRLLNLKLTLDQTLVYGTRWSSKGMSEERDVSAN